MGSAAPASKHGAHGLIPYQVCSPGEAEEINTTTVRRLSFLYCPLNYAFFKDKCIASCLSVSLTRREEVTKLKFEAKTFHIYANQTEVRVYYLLKPSPF